jgi:hypothetical protein
VNALLFSTLFVVYILFYLLHPGRPFSPRRVDRYRNEVMKSTAAAVLALMGAVSARDVNVHSLRLGKREVPQEKSHQNILDIVDPILKEDNPLEIVDVVFALLGNAAAAEGAPNVDNLDCLQQIIADQVFTTAKANNDIDGMSAAIVFRALERNTGQVGLASVLCNEDAVNPEIAAITQHQDPASDEGIAGNADIEIQVAIQIASIGGDPLFALQSATFPPGEVSTKQQVQPSAWRKRNADPAYSLETPLLRATPVTTRTRLAASTPWVS